MSKTFEEGRSEIIELCRYFQTNRRTFMDPSMKEAQVRQLLIDPLFEALGWDVHNRQRIAPQYMEVVWNPSLEGEGERKEPDYEFRVGSNVKFFVEAKKCGVNLSVDPLPAYQLRRYGWSAKTSLSLLTDFEELGVYDCTARPRPGDKASHARTLYFTSEEYPDRWREVWEIFSREAVWSGSFDQYAASKRKRGTSEVDVEFLREIEGWRDVLARNLALRNKDLSTDDLNTAVQTIIDRIVFLRMAEDRGLEPYGQLLKLTEASEIYGRFMQRVCRHADEKYNSGLFHFKREAEVSEKPDTITPGLAIDDKTLKPILQSLYFEHGSPYHFGVMPVEILGTVYERFLGKVIRLTAGHQAKVEEKPEVRKAGGVYYTPAYIVDYIVKQTVGRMIEGKSPAQLASPRFRVLDMACGSGSFLLGAYQCLLDHCLKWHQDHKPETHKKAVRQSPRDGQWRLTIEEKKRILTTHIFGVDIDPQAVGVSKLSLLLKVLEDEDAQTIDQNLDLFRQRALPNLADNLKCGNSLIGPDYFTGRLQLDPDELKRVNPFDWHKEFPEAMRDGGFDCVIGNPPYVRQETLGDNKQLFQTCFAVYHGTADLYAYFIEKGVSLVRENGHFGFIVSNKWMRANYGEPLRRWLKGQAIDQIIDFGDLPVFSQATTYPCILLISKKKPENAFIAVNVESLKFANLDEYVKENSFTIKQNELHDKGWSLADKSVLSLLEKIHAVGVPLGEYIKGKIYRGVLTGLNEAFVIDEETKKRLIAKDKKSAELIKPFLRGRDIKRYIHSQSDMFLIFTRRGVNISRYPAISHHLEKYKTQLMPKPRNWKAGKWPGRKPGAYKWYEIQDTIDYYEEFDKPKIIVPAIVQKASYLYDEDGFLSNDKTTIISTNDKYLLGLLNSKVPDYIMCISQELTGHIRPLGTSRH